MDAIQFEQQGTVPPEAGALARALTALKLDRPLVLALPPGGMGVAVELAHALQAPLDLLLVDHGKASVTAPPGLRPAPLRDHAVVVVDGGAGEAALHDALKAVHRLGAARVVLAVPQVAPVLAPTLAVLVDDLVGLPRPAAARLPASPMLLPPPASLGMPGAATAG